LLKKVGFTFLCQLLWQFAFIFSSNFCLSCQLG
jgi:hypothetical protein